MVDINDIEITPDLMYAVALAQLYREDAVTTIKRQITQKLTATQMDMLNRKIITHPDFAKYKQEAIDLECKTLVDDNMETIMLYYNKLLKQAQHQEKFDVAARILKEIRQIKALDNEQVKFEIEITVKGMGEKVDSTHSHSSST